MAVDVVSPELPGRKVSPALPGCKVSPALLGWYDAHARALPWRSPPGTPAPDPYRVWLSEVMLQQTGTLVVSRYFARFVALWPTVGSLAAAPDADVLREWAGLGYYARARNLIACARAVVAEHGGRFPETAATLRTLPGIGDYTAAAIAAIAFGEAAVVVDGNVERVVARLFAVATALPAAKPVLRACAARLTPMTRPGDHAQAMMDLGATICTPRRPACPRCPVAAGCLARAEGDPARYPVRVRRAPKPVRHGVAWWIEAAAHVLLVRRPASGLLGGMLGLPTSDWGAAATPAPPLAGDWQAAGHVRHVFTHFELHLDVRALRLPVRPALAGDWVPVANIADAGLPTLFTRAALAVADAARHPEFDLHLEPAAL